MDNENSITYNGDRSLLREQFDKILKVGNRAHVAAEARIRLERAAEATCMGKHAESRDEAPSAPIINTGD
jgi:hypothetical protein